MTNDPFFNPIAIQLIETPSSSREALQASANRPVNAEPRFIFPIDSARSWVREVLNEHWSYPPKTAFIAFPQEAGVADVIRAGYQTKDAEIEIAQTFHILSIRVRIPDRGSRQPAVKMAEELARRLFNQPDRMRFEESGPFDGGAWGKQISTRDPSTPPGWPNWVDELRWWSKGNDVGFLTLKAAGGPTKALISPAPALNVKWF